jgi:hypoxanthine phosphoribosyltransferase
MQTEAALRTLFSPAQVSARIGELVDKLYRAYADSPVLFVVIAEGARRFAEALVQGLSARGVVPELLYLRAQRTEGTELGSVQVQAVDPAAFEDRDVLVIDDIADEGRTLDAVLQIVREGEPRTVRTAVLVSKTQRRRVNVPLDYTGFEVKSGWVVGFGMDLDGRYRDLDSLAIIEE